MAKILLIEDDTSISATISDWLQAQFHTVERVETGKQGAELLQYYSYDLVILDLTLPDMDGIDLLRDYRAAGGGARVLILSGRTAVPERERGLDSGADDYLTKPFDAKELSARLRALLRRPELSGSPSISIGSMNLDLAGCKLTRDGREIPLQPKEFALVEFFMRNPDHVFSSDAILNRVWQSSSETSPETLRVHITKLRSKLDIDGKPSVIRTLKGVGYMLDSAACT